MTQKLIDEQVVRQVADQADLSPSYLTFMATAGMLAAVALLSNSVPILLGAMIVAPALAPLALVAFGLLGGQARLALRGLWIGLLGLLVATLVAMATTWLLNVTDVIPQHANLLEKPLLEERVRPGWYSLAAAIAAGIVGTLALSKQKTDTLVGTVAALALVPAGAAAGIAFLSHDPVRGLGGLLLLALNVSLIIAMGIVVLLVIAAKERGAGRVARPAAPLLLIAIALVAAVSLALAVARGTGAAPSKPPSFNSKSAPG